MARSSGTYTAPSNNFNPAVQGETLDPDDWNTTIQDLEDALTESVYTAGLGSSDEKLVRTDGTDTKKVQGTGITVNDTDMIAGCLSITLTPTLLANLPTPAEGMVAYASNARKNGEGVGSGTGCLVFYDGSNWIAVDTGATAAA
jgi:hypothetical protein